VIVEVQRRDHVQRLTWEDFEQRVRDGEIASDAWVRFEVVTGREFRPLAELELFETLADPADMAFRAQLGRRPLPILTAILVGVQVRIYASSWMPGVESVLQERFTNWSPAILERGEVWRLLSYGLLHVELTHLLFNMLFLAYTGYHLERALGRWNLLLLY
jgi:membrane associated rhomboid family serine protease